MSDIEALTWLLGAVEEIDAEIEVYDTSLEMHRKMKGMIQSWVDRVIDMIDDYEEVNE